MLSHQTGYIALSAVHALGAMILGVHGDALHASISLAVAAVYAGLTPRRLADDAEYIAFISNIGY